MGRYITTKSKVLCWTVAVILGFPMRNQIVYPLWHDEKHRPHKTVIVTGATEPMGKATSYLYARRQCRVIMACREMDKCLSFRRELVVDSKNKSIVCRHLDLEDVGSINKFADEIIEKEPHVDVLVNNGFVFDRSGEKMSKYGIEKHFFANFLGPFLLTLRLLDKLEETASNQHEARIVNVVGKPKRRWRIDLNDINFEKTRYTSKRAYEQSKLAMAYFTILLNQRLREKNSRINVFGNGFDASPKYIVDELNPKASRGGVIFQSYFHPTATCLSGNSLMCGLNENLGQKDSGSLYKFLYQSYGRNKGWGPAGDNEIAAKQVWNFGVNFLANLEEPKVSDSNAPIGDDKLQSPQDSDKTPSVTTAPR